MNRERNKEKKRKIAFCILLMGVVPAAIGIPHFIRAKTVSSCVFSSHLALFRRLPCLMCVRSLPFRVAILRNRNPQKKKEERRRSVPEQNIRKRNEGSALIQPTYQRVLFFHMYFNINAPIADGCGVKFKF